MSDDGSAPRRLPTPVAEPYSAPRIAVVVPCYSVRGQVLDVLAAMPAMIDAIYCVDDACPEQCGDLVESQCADPRVTVLRHDSNRGVGGAMVTGYKAALAGGADIVVKIDGDGQMNPALVPLFADPILAGEADYTKGNRFYRPESLGAMPAIRLYGNAVLSFLSKLSTGYWHTFDPNNGYTAIHARVLDVLPLDKLARDYFFEADMLFRLSTVRAAVVDIPIDAVYGGEKSSLRIGRTGLSMLRGHVRNFFKRLFYAYFLRDFSVASIEWLLGPALLLFGTIFGIAEWSRSVESGQVASAGSVMLAALPVIVGFQLLLSAINHDVQSVPRRAAHKHLARRRASRPDTPDLAEAGDGGSQPEQRRHTAP